MPAGPRNPRGAAAMLMIKGVFIMYCRNCSTQVAPGNTFCTSCGTPVGSGSQFCPNCGTQAGPEAQTCGHCGCPLHGGTPVYTDQRSKLAAGLLGIFVGYLGIHNFYLGYTNRAILQLVLGTVGGFLTCGITTTVVGIWGLVEGILLLTGRQLVDARGIPLRD